MDLAAYEHATLALTAALSGHEGSAQLSELPLLPVAPWNRRPGYLVSFECRCLTIVVICSSHGHAYTMH